MLACGKSRFRSVTPPWLTFKSHVICRCVTRNQGFHPRYLPPTRPPLTQSSWECRRYNLAWQKTAGKNQTINLPRRHCQSVPFLWMIKPFILTIDSMKWADITIEIPHETLGNQSSSNCKSLLNADLVGINHLILKNQKNGVTRSRHDPTAVPFVPWWFLLCPFYP